MSELCNLLVKTEGDFLAPVSLVAVPPPMSTEMLSFRVSGFYYRFVYDPTGPTSFRTASLSTRSFLKLKRYTNLLIYNFKETIGMHLVVEFYKLQVTNNIKLANKDTAQCRRQE